MLGIKILNILKLSIVGKVPYFYFDICTVFRIKNFLYMQVNVINVTNTMLN